MYRVMSGHVRVEKGNDSTKVGQGAVLNSLGSGHTFGEMSFLDGSLPCANCIAEEDSVQVRLAASCSGGRRRRRAPAPPSLPCQAAPHGPRPRTRRS